MTVNKTPEYAVFVLTFHNHRPELKGKMKERCNVKDGKRAKEKTGVEMNGSGHREQRAGKAKTNIWIPAATDEPLHNSRTELQTETNDKD